MKKIAFVLTLLAFISKAQVSPTFTNSSPGTTPGNPGLNMPPNNNTNPTGMPNQVDPFPVTPPVPTSTYNNYPGERSTTPSVTPTLPYPTNPTSPTPSVSPAYPYPNNPNITTPSVTPTMPYQPSPINTFSPQTNRLFQDPSRTPRYPDQVDPVRTISGSTGKYRKKHKTVNGHKFGKSYHHMKTAKQSKNKKEGQPREIPEAK
jgi:hypothetical protein